MTRSFDIGLKVNRLIPPEELLPYIQRVEALGFDEAWLVEDCFYAGGIAPMAVALSHTDVIRVGMGIMPAVMRNPATTAMEFATLARMFPGRIMPGLGHGVAGWMKQIGAFPESQMAALEDVTLTVKALLRGERVDYEGPYARLDGVELEFPPEVVPEIMLGVRGPKSLALSGRVADGTLLAEYSSADYVRWAIAQIRAGQTQAGRQHETHRIAVYAYCAIDEDRDAAIARMRPQVAAALASGSLNTYTDPLGITDEVAALAADGGEAALIERMPDEWVTALTIAGTPEDCRAVVDALSEAGADSVIVAPIDWDWDTLELIGESLESMLG